MSKNFIDPLKLAKDLFDAVGSDYGKHGTQFYDRSKTESMKIKQVYAETFPKLFVCHRCGGDQFNVASEEHFTAIRCPKCLWEVCVHDG
jgi:DNA-directed RNA polymerase subunit RPC12/RpoP